jgi:hypothetical protein
MAEIPPRKKPRATATGYLSLERSWLDGEAPVGASIEILPKPSTSAVRCK